MVDHQQKGTALITAMVIMSILAAVATVIMIQQSTTIYRSQLLFNVDRAYLYTNGTVVWAENLLKQDEQFARAEDTVMVVADVLPATATPYNEGQVWAELIDLQGRFNLNNLHYDALLNDKLDHFRRLLSIILFDIDENQIKQIIQSMTDYIVSQDPQQNPFFHISQLRMIEGVTAEIYQRISPYLTALPESTDINVNTATAPILMSLSQQLSASDVETLIQNRQQTPFISTDAFMSAMSEDSIALEADMITVQSQYFLLSSTVLIDQQQLNTYTVFHLLNGEGQSVINILWQSMGTV